MTLAAEIERNPEPIDRLTAGQAKMVHVLRAAAGRIVTVCQLGEAVCRDPVEPPLSNSVTSMMCQLRRRRPDIGAQIETIRGLGYRWRHG